MRQLSIFVFSLLFGLSILLPAASAAGPIEALQDQIGSLLSKFASAPTGCSVPAAPLALGSYGPEVKKLQVWLGQHGYPVVAAGKESQYFGPLTHFALIKFQSAAGIRPVSGFYGPITKAEIEKRCAEVDGPSKSLHIELDKDASYDQVVVRGSTRVPVLVLDFSGESTLRSLTLRHYGVGKISGYERVYLYDGNIRLTEAAAIDPTSKDVVISDINIPVNGSRKLTVMADLSRTAGNNKDGFEIINAASVDADGVVSGSFPIRGGLFARLDIAVGALAVSKSGQSEAVIIGQANAQIGEFGMTASEHEDVELESVTLTLAGSLSPALVSNFTLQHQGKSVATASTVNARNQIVLNLNQSTLIKKGITEIFTLVADIALGAGEGEVLQVYIESPVDVHAKGLASKFGVSISAAEYNNSAKDGSDASWSVVRGGVVTLTFRGPSATNYAASQRDIELIRFDVTAKSAIEIQRIRLALISGGADAAMNSMITEGGLCNHERANYTDIKLVDVQSGRELTRTFNVKCSPASNDSSQIFVFEDKWQVQAGQVRTIKVIANASTFVPSAGETIRAALLSSQDGDIRNLETGNYLNTEEVLPAGNMTGATHRIHANEQVANLATTLASVLSDTPSVNN